MYEWCDWHALIDKFVGWFSMDWASLGEQVTQAGIYLGIYAKDFILDVLDNLGNNCINETMSIVQDLVDQGFEELDEYLTYGDDEIDVEELMDVIADSVGDAANDILNCVIKDMDLHEVGLNLGIIMSDTLQIKLDSVA